MDKEMEVYYRREMRHNYLVIVPEQSDITGYECGMLANNGIDGLLKFRLSRPEGQICFYYEITSKQPLSRILASRGIRIMELRSLILGISGVLAQIEAYLLPEEQILLEPDYIYVEPDTFHTYLCLVPSLARDFPAGMEQLLQYLLGCVDHQDKECVVLAYGLYQECQKENFGIEDLLRLVRESINQTLAPYEIKGAENVTEVETLAMLKPQFTLKPSATLNPSTMLKPATVPKLAAMPKLPATSKPAPAANSAAMPNQAVTLLQPEKLVMPAVGADVGVHPSDTESGIKKNSWRERLSDAVNRLSGKNPERKEESDWGSWQEFFEEQDPIAEEKGKEIEQEPMTTLLADLIEKGEGYCLKALQLEGADIMLEYFPFVIGKDSSLADYHLDHETVSRLHAKIDKSSDGFLITDLNSTNGTSVRGRLLENNECEVLQIGDEIGIAEWQFQFRQI